MNNLEMAKFFNRPRLEYRRDKPEKYHTTVICECGESYSYYYANDGVRLYKEHLEKYHTNTPPWNENLDHKFYNLFLKCVEASVSSPVFIKQTLNEVMESWQRGPGRKNVIGYFGPFTSWQDVFRWMVDKPHRKSDDYSYSYEVVTTDVPELGDLETYETGEKYVKFLENYLPIT